ncbi:MAG: efflux RND transporter periplasmic adaptor subunit [Candidatus Palauibacterales bacterium]|nr:efflux RND transporter periplasmic adaptor subunit [Candidatus Palauibacterales bacterium]MDP2483100.1 efflux RND transporter periplasmic adaptor subunit [Candidatus Palauibacterales bacterium]
MKTRTKVGMGLVGLVVVAGVAAVSLRGGNGDEGPATVEVTRGSIVQKALAIGNIEPDIEIGIKSQVAGVVRELFVEDGDYVTAGARLLEVKPNPTPIELAEAKRQVELRQIELENMERDLERKRELRGRDFITQEELELAEREFERSRIQVQMATERVALLETGKVRIADRDIEGVIRSPIDGFVLETRVETGDPVVPLSAFQEGTVLITMAEMNNLIFRGTVDEIDVGKLHEGMPADVKVGALPDAAVRGEVYLISLKARSEDNSTVFPIEVRLTEVGDAVLRAGYSANVDIIIDRRDDVLVIPERLVRTEDDVSRVTILLPDGETEEREIETGLSDALSIEVVSGLHEGDLVVEPPPREIH